MRVALVSAAAIVLLAGLVPFDLSARQAQAGRRLEISFDMQGRVTLVAQNVTIREILAEWQRVGGSQIIDAERLGGAPVPMLQFDARPETEVMDSLLRSAAGYILGPRTARTAGPSIFETVMILPTSTPTASSAYTPPAAQPLRTQGSPDDEIAPVTPAQGIPAPGQPPPAPNPAANRPTTPGVFVPIVPVTPVTGRGRGGGFD
jgi:hypothetical protein